MVMYRYEKQNTADSIYKERTSHYRDVSAARRKTTTLAKLFGASTFDLIKLDVQVREHQVGVWAALGRGDNLGSWSSEVRPT